MVAVASKWRISLHLYCFFLNSTDALNPRFRSVAIAIAPCLPLVVRSKDKMVKKVIKS